jgi:LysR family transcriptional regulator, low CO2-responsive transcriptional regulator
VTLTQLSAFVLVARLGSVTAAAAALGVSEPAVSQALASLRQHFGDPLLVRSAGGMKLTAGGGRLLGIASQMVTLGADADAAVRAAKGAPEQLRLVATSTFAEFVAAPMVDAFTRRSAGSLEASCGVATGSEMPVLVANRLADVAIGPYLGRAAVHPAGGAAAAGARGPGETAAPGAELVSEPVFRSQLIVVGAGAKSGRSAPPGAPAQWPWLVDPSGTDPRSDTGRLLHRMGVAESRVRVFPNQTAAWAAAADGAGVAPAAAHLVTNQLRRGELAVLPTAVTPMEASWHATLLRPDRRSAAAGAFRRFLQTPEAMHLMRAPGAGVPPSRFRPPVYVTIWS